MRSLKELAADVIGARSNVLNKEDDLRRAKEAYIKAEGAYLRGMGNRIRATVFQSTVIDVSGMYPDTRDGDHLDFEVVEIL